MIRNMANITRKFIGSGMDVGEHHIGNTEEEESSHASPMNTMPPSSSIPAVLPHYTNVYTTINHLPSDYHHEHEQEENHVSVYNQGVMQSGNTLLSLSYQNQVDSLFSSVQIPQSHVMPPSGESSDLSCAQVSESDSNVTDINLFKNSDERRNLTDSRVQFREISLEAQNKKKESNWKKNVRKKLKNLGKAYTMQSGKEVDAKVFKLVTQCCVMKCFQNVSEEDQKNGFTMYWNLGDWNKQTEFLWNHILIKETARKTVNASCRRVHTRLFHIPNVGGEKVRVCKKMFLDLLQVSNGRLSYTLGQKLVAGADTYPSDKRGLNTPYNKTPLEAVQDAEKYIQSLPYYKINIDNGRKIFSVPQGVTIRKVYSLYRRSLMEAGKSPISLKVFRKIIPDIHKKDALSMPLPLVSYRQHKKMAVNHTTSNTNERTENIGNCSQSVMQNTVCSTQEQLTSVQVCSSDAVGLVKDPQDVSVTVDVIGRSDTHGIPLTSSSEVNLQDNINKCHRSFTLENGTATIGKSLQFPSASNHEHPSVSNRRNPWNQTIRKKLRDQGKSYVAPSGKVIWAKEFVPQYSCCVRKCHQLIPVEQQEILFRKYWSLGSWNLQTKFLWDHIEIENTKSHSSKVKDYRRIHTRNFYFRNHEGEKHKVCKNLFCTTLQISNGRIAGAVNLKVTDSTSNPQDKRGKNPPGNKASVSDIEFMNQHIRQLLQQLGCQREMSQKFTLPVDMTIKSAYEAYKNSCVQQSRKSLCYTLFARALHKEMDDSLVEDCAGTLVS